MDTSKVNKEVSALKYLRKGAMLLSGVGVVLLLLCSLFLVLDACLVYDKPLERAGALVVLAGDPGARLSPAAQLYLEGVSPVILLTNDGVLGRWSREYKKNLYQVDWAEQELIERGVPKSAIVKLPFSKSGTYFDAHHALEYARQNKIDSLLIVTTDFHTRRTYWTFNHLVKGLDITLGIYPVTATKLPGLRLGHFGKRVKQLSLELLKVIYYQLNYGF